MGYEVSQESVMTYETFPRRAHKFIERNPYREIERHPQKIVSFHEARERLPTPVLPQRPDWEEMYWRAWEIAWRNLRQPHSGSGFVASFIDSAFNQNTFMWDTAFMTQFGIYGRRVFDFLGSLENFYASQHDDGYICREINMSDGHDYFFPFDPNGTGPNVMAWAEWRAFRHTKDEERLSCVFWPLIAFHDWLKAHRTWPSGLYWASGLSSGMDNQPRAEGSRYHHCHLTWVDANMQAALNCWVLAQMAQLLDEAALAEALNEERAFLHREINGRMWDDETGFYHDLDPGGRRTSLKTIGAYWGLLDKDLVPPDHAEPFIRHLRDQQAFNRPHRIPSIAADSEGYDPATGNYWCGGVWSPTNYMVLKGLRQAGQDRLAHQIALNHLENVSTVFQHTDTFWEDYAPEEAKPGEPAKSDFVGWTGVTAISILLEDVIGVSVDWPLRQIIWDRRLEEEGTYGVRNYPLGRKGVLHMTGDGTTIEIVTDSSFTLKVKQGETTLQTAVPAGESTITL